MELGMVIWFLCVGGCALTFTGIGIYAYRRKEPMWFWSGSIVRKEELTDVQAYNHANGIMWILFQFPIGFQRFYLFGFQRQQPRCWF